MKIETCLWTEDSDGNWETSCKEIFILTDRTPTQNSMKFCPFCGKPLYEKEYEE